MADRLRAAIVGAGLGGLAAAVALTRCGIEVRVYEQAAELGEVGAGVAVCVNGLRVLEGLGLGEPVRRWGARMARPQLCLADGQPMAKPPGTFARAGQNLGFHRADLLAVLAGALPAGVVLTGHRCTGFDGDSGVRFANGASADADVVIGADGIHSVLQGYAVEPSEPVYSGVVAYRGVVPADRVPAWPAGMVRLWMGEGRHFLVYPVRAGELLNYVGFLPAEAGATESWSARDHSATLAEGFAGWDPVVATIIDAIGGDGFRSGLYDRAPLRQWSTGRLTLLGDAAHPMLPHLGQGLNQAFEDAAALASLLRGACPQDVPAALAAYETLRREHTARVQHASRLDGTGYDSSGERLGDHGWIYDYDIQAALDGLMPAP